MAFSDAMSQLTYDEFERRAKEHDVWFNPIRMPVQLLAYDQAKINSLFMPSGYGDHVLVTSPLKLDH